VIVEAETTRDHVADRHEHRSVRAPRSPRRRRRGLARAIARALVVRAELRVVDVPSRRRRDHERASACRDHSRARTLVKRKSCVSKRNHFAWIFLGASPSLGPCANSF
jgi:hypothetical protein